MLYVDTCLLYSQILCNWNEAKKMYCDRMCLQNGTLAVFVATQMFNDIAYMIPTAAYALIMYLTGFTLIFILRRAN